MHVPDGLFSIPVSIVFTLIVVAVLAVALRMLSRQNDHRLVPLMGVMAAFIFASQMVNFPVGPGTTGHLLGGTLAAILLGPWAATLVMATVVFFQALIGDGGITALGPNIFNMGVIGTCVGYLVYRAVLGQATRSTARVVGASFFAAWVAVVLGSVFVSFQLAASGTVSLARTLPPMVLTHMVIGVCEALITAFIIAFVLRTRPELLYDHGREGESSPLSRPAVASGLVVSLLIASLLSLAATTWHQPDGFESVGLAQGFIADEPEEDGGGTNLVNLALTGALGTLAMFGVSFAMGRVLTRPSRLVRAVAASQDNPA